ncbi:MAG: S8 family serine peptidase, partial [Clostridiales bacterium]
MNNVKLCYDVKIKRNKIIKKSNKNYNNYLNHGTICSSIISKYNKNVVFSSIDIINRSTGKCSIDNLILAIKWCYRKKIDILNISLGTIDIRDIKFLNMFLNKYIKKNMKIVAAFDNSNVKTSPASHYKILGVVTDHNLTNSKFIVKRNDEKGIDFIASGKHYINNLYNTNAIITPPKNSYAAPLITSLVASLISINPKISIKEIKEHYFEIMNKKGDNIK